MRQALLVLLLLVGLPGCATVSSPCRQDEFPASLHTLYFGTERVGAEPVTQAQWLGFLEHDVTPAFPEGLTWWAARGQWRDPEGELSEEATFVLQLLHRGEAEEARKVDTLIETYKKQFAQKAVLSTRRTVCAEL